MVFWGSSDDLRSFSRAQRQSLCLPIRIRSVVFDMNITFRDLLSTMNHNKPQQPGAMLSACLTGVLGVIRSLALSGNGFGCCVSLLLIAADWVCFRWWSAHLLLKRATGLGFSLEGGVLAVEQAWPSCSLFTCWASGWTVS